MSSSNSSEDISKMNSQQQGSNGPIVHMRADSDSTLDDLFAIVTKGTQRQLQVPMKMRNLPPSFWKPPPSGSKSPSCHSRENSVDNTLDPMSPGMQSVGSPQPAPSPQQQSQPFHSRAHSSPATLQQSLAVAQNQHLHLRQPSYDVSTPGDNLGPLPLGWEMAKTPSGQLYFMNHITKTTQWEDPRRMQQQQQELIQINNPQPQQQRAPPTSVPSHQPPKINAQHLRSNSFDNLGPLPQGWEQSVTAEGETYFINHISKVTTWFDPRVPALKQSVPIRQQTVPENDDESMSDEQKRQQQLRLQRLDAERRTLQQRQLELKQRQEALTIKHQRSLSQENMIQQTQEMFMRQSIRDNSNPSNNMDPFLSTVINQSEVHNRQESADSGVGMGSNFNLGSIPEDLPIDMESAMDLDSTLTPENNSGTTSTSNSNNNTGNNNNTNNEGGGGGGGDMDTNGDSDQLIASLPAGELNEVLSNDIMQDVLSSGSNRGGVLTWL